MNFCVYCRRHYQPSNKAERVSNNKTLRQPIICHRFHSGPFDNFPTVILNLVCNFMLLSAKSVHKGCRSVEFFYFRLNYHSFFCLRRRSFPRPLELHPRRNTLSKWQGATYLVYSWNSNWKLQQR